MDDNELKFRKALKEIFGIIIPAEMSLEEADDSFSITITGLLALWNRARIEPKEFEITSSELLRRMV